MTKLLLCFRPGAVEYRNVMRNVEIWRGPATRVISRLVLLCVAAMPCLVACNRTPEL